MADRPTAAELVTAVREVLESDVLGAIEGRVGFHVRVAINALGIVERELIDGTANEESERAAILALLGNTALETAATDDLRRDLAAGIRRGDFDARFDEVFAALQAVTAATIAVDNPRYAG